jgi:sugar lactone lactonase YvrE
MRIQSFVLAGVLLASFCGEALAQGAATPAPDAQEIAKRAEALTHEQIKSSKDMAGLGKLAQIYETKGDLDRLAWTLDRLVEMMPNSGLLKLQLALVYAKQSKKSEAYDVLIKLQTQGFDYDISKDPRFENVRGTKVWDYIVANLQANSKQFGEGKVAFDIAKGDRLIESIGYDPKRKEFLFGSVREGKIYRADNTGKLKDFITADGENGMWSVYAIGVDVEHDKLYVASSGVPYFKGFNSENFGKAGLFVFDLSTGKFRQRYLVPKDQGAHLLTSLAVSKDGRVYAADGARRQIFKLDGDALKLIFDDPKLTSIHGITVSDDGKTLYMADYALGLFGIDLTNGKPFAVAHNPERLVVGGTDGLTYYDGNLIIVENGMTPQRVMRLQLTPDGRGIASAMPLDVAQPAFENPTVGTLVGDNFYFLASSERDLYDDNGVLTAADKLEPTPVFRSNARFAWGQKGVGSAVSNVPIDKAATVRPPNAVPGVTGKPAKKAAQPAADGAGKS